MLIEPFVGILAKFNLVDHDRNLSPTKDWANRMKYKVTHKTQYAYSSSASVCHNAVHLAPRGLAHQSCTSSRILIHPAPGEVTEQTDYFGNRVHYFAVHERHEQLSVTAVSRIEVLPTPEPSGPSVPWEEVAAGLSQDKSLIKAFEFSFDSPNIRKSEALASYAKKSFTPGRPILEAARDLTARVFSDFQYDSKATKVDTPLEKVLELRRGVCQDFAHLQVGCLRSLGLAARYVSGYLRTYPPEGKPRLIGADASHAWLSVYCGSLGWIDFDPTNDVIPGEDHITVGWGRDYGDVCPIQGVFVGGGKYTMNVSVDVAPVEV